MAQHPPVLMLLSVDKIREGEYVANVRYGSVPVYIVDAPRASLAEAIGSTAAAIPHAYAGFVEVRYAGVCGGTFSVRELANAKTAHEVATRIIEVVAGLRTRV